MGGVQGSDAGSEVYWESGQDSGGNPPALPKSARGSLTVTVSQARGLTPRGEDHTFHGTVPPPCFCSVRGEERPLLAPNSTFLFLQQLGARSPAQTLSEPTPAELLRLSIRRVRSGVVPDSTNDGECIKKKKI